MKTIEVFTFNIREMRKKVRKPRIKGTIAFADPRAYKRFPKHKDNKYED